MDAIHWQKEILEFQDQPLSEILPMLETFYDISFELTEPTLENCRYNGFFSRKSLKDGLEAFSGVLGFSYDQEGNHFILEGKGCAKKPQ